MSDLPTEKEFRDAGMTAAAINFPLSGIAIDFVAAWNGVRREQMPRAWKYAPNPAMLAQVEAMARGTWKKP